MTERKRVRPDPTLVGRRFSRTALDYAGDAWHQRMAAGELAEAISTDPRPARILEWGCGTGALTERMLARLPVRDYVALDISPGMLRCCGKRLAEKYPAIRFVMADAETWRDDDPFDLLASSCSAQWFPHRPRLAQCCASCVRPGGMVAMAIPAAGTLGEFWSSLSSVGDRGRTGLDLWESERYFRLFDVPDWQRVRCWTRRYVRYFASAAEAIRSISRIGVSCGGHPGWVRMTPAELRRLAVVYSSDHSGPDGVPCTYEVAFILARKVS